MHYNLLNIIIFDKEPKNKKKKRETHNHLNMQIEYLHDVNSTTDVWFLNRFFFLVTFNCWLFFLEEFVAGFLIPIETINKTHNERNALLSDTFAYWNFRFLYEENDVLKIAIKFSE